MSACEECWGAAYLAMRTRGGFQADRYHEELAKHPEHAHSDPDSLVAPTLMQSGVEL